MRSMICVMRSSILLALSLLCLTRCMTRSTNPAVMVAVLCSRLIYLLEVSINDDAEDVCFQSINSDYFLGYFLLSVC